MRFQLRDVRGVRRGPLKQGTLFGRKTGQSVRKATLKKAIRKTMKKMGYIEQ
jgi:hypothetical protein